MPKKTLDPDALKVESYATAAPAPAADATRGPVATRVTSCPDGPPRCTC
ncbi:MAG TPA: hypothetical protein VF092_03595 [Longimicrobium sp.]